MADALMDMKDAPRDGRPVLLYWEDTQTCCIGRWSQSRRLWSAPPHSSSAFDEYFAGWLPTQYKYPVSGAIAKTAGEWLSVCEPGHRMTVLKSQMDRMTEDELAEVEQYVELRRTLSTALDGIAALIEQEPTDEL